MSRLRYPQLMRFATVPAAAGALVAGVAAAALGFFIPGLLGGRGPELGVLSLMLTATPAVFVFSMEQASSERPAWAKLWLLLFCYFLGIIGFVAAWCLTRSAEQVWSAFGFLTALPEINLLTLDQGSFAAAWRVIPHNLGVALAMAFLTMIYGVAGGSVLLTWNACVWSITLTLLILRSAGLTGYGEAVLAVFPHTVVELSAYCLIVAAVAGFRQSRLVPPPWGRMAAMMLLAIFLIGMAGLLEAGWPRYILGR